MAYESPARTPRQATPTVFGRCSEFLPPKVSWPKSLRDAEARWQEAALRRHQAHRIHEAIKTVLDPEWEKARKEWDLAQAATVAPEDYAPYPEPKPDAEEARRVAALYENAARLAGREVEKVAGDPAVWQTITAAWLHWSAQTPTDAMTVGEARGLEATKAAALAALRLAGEAAVMSQGASDDERKAWKKAAVEEGVLTDLRVLRDRLRGRTPEKVAAAEKAAEAKRLERQETQEYAAQNARRNAAAIRGEVEA